jgi:predicted alpha/beta-fold hydrolase
VYHRRGHAKPLKKPEFNLFGKASDLHQAVLALKKERPQAPVALVGSSAGSALVVRYLGEYSHLGLVACGVGLSPGRVFFAFILIRQ